MPEPSDDFLNELNARFPVDEKFMQNIRPLVERIFDRSVAGDERKRLLKLVEETFRRQCENRDNLDRAKDGIHRIFSTLYDRILTDLGHGDQAGSAPDVGDLPDLGAEESAADHEDEDPSFDEWEPGAEPVWGQDEDDTAHDHDPRRRDVLFGEFLVRRGVLDHATLLGALEEQVRDKPLIGWVALRRGCINEEQLLQILTRQAREDRRFGEIALEEGFIGEDDLDGLRRVQKKYTPLLGKILVNRGDLSREALDYFLEEYAAELGKH